MKARYVAEKGLADAAVSEMPLIGNGGSIADTGEALRLRALRDCTGVNALAEHQEITFNPRMTVLFGENATGKTGCVRILKRLANVRSAEEIIADIHRPSSSHAPHSLVKYALGDDEQEVAWNGERGVPPFTRMSVFDSPAVALHLEESVTYLYTPADLALFKYAHAAIENVRALLEAEIALRRPRQNPFLTAFARGTPVYPKIEGLGASTNLADLEELATVSEAERTELESLRLSVDTLASAASDGRAEMLRT
ncbi:MAG: ATP-binding protein, partial [Acidimicrobiia bacterium]